MSIGQRIKELIKEKDISVQKFASIIGQAEKSVYNYANGKTMPKADVLQKIISSYPDVNSNWLLTGQGPMFLEDNSVRVEFGGKRNTQVSEANSQRMDNRLNSLEW
jgi:transcriptional regulator with XRE-family HTH domain